MAPKKISLKKIDSATEYFNPGRLIGQGGYGKVYRGITEKNEVIAVKVMDKSERREGEEEFEREIQTLSNCDNENIVSLVGFCKENDRRILVYEYISKGSLATHLGDCAFKWVDRLHTCKGIALGLDYLHSGVGPDKKSILHLDVKSSNVLLGDDWKPKISDLGTSREAPVKAQSYVYGTKGYTDPEYSSSGVPTTESDVYSFGVVLWEVLCGRRAGGDLATLVQDHYTKGTLRDIIPSDLYKQIKYRSLLTFTYIAYGCLKKREERPTMKEVIQHLEQARLNQTSRPPSMQVLVLSVSIPSCDNCDRLIRKCLIGFDGVQDVTTNCNTHEILVKGPNTDQRLKVLGRLRNEIKRHVKLVKVYVEDTHDAMRC